MYLCGCLRLCPGVLSWPAGQCGWLVVVGLNSSGLFTMCAPVLELCPKLALGHARRWGPGARDHQAASGLPSGPTGKALFLFFLLFVFFPSILIGLRTENQQASLSISFFGEELLVPSRIRVSDHPQADAVACYDTAFLAVRHHSARTMMVWMSGNFRPVPISERFEEGLTEASADVFSTQQVKVRRRKPSLTNAEQRRSAQDDGSPESPYHPTQCRHGDINGWSDDEDCEEGCSGRDGRDDDEGDSTYINTSDKHRRLRGMEADRKPKWLDHHNTSNQKKVDLSLGTQKSNVGPKTGWEVNVSSRCGTAAGSSKSTGQVNKDDMLHLPSILNPGQPCIPPMLLQNRTPRTPGGSVTQRSQHDLQSWRMAHLRPQAPLTTRPSAKSISWKESNSPKTDADGRLLTPSAPVSWLRSPRDYTESASLNNSPSMTTTASTIRSSVMHHTTSTGTCLAGRRMPARPPSPCELPRRPRYRARTPPARAKVRPNRLK